MPTSLDSALYARWKDAPRKTILISGSSGFIGSALTNFLATAGHRVIRLVRRPAERDDERSWDPTREMLAPAVFNGVDVVIHLAGENLLAHRWNKRFKDTIRDSRVISSRLLCQTIATLTVKPELVIMASAVGFYGNTADTPMDESCPPGSGFLADTTKAWEESARVALQGSTRLIHMRMGTVLNASGGALKKMLPVFKLGLGGILGDGKQYMSWIALHDIFGIVEHAIYTTSLQGPFNAVAPESVTNREFTNTLGRMLHRPTLIPAPAFALKLVLGEVAEAALLSSSRVVPKALVASGYTFMYPRLAEALRFECGVT